MAADSIKIPGYEILRTLGSGGMSSVYLALQRSLDRKVAVKIMRRNFDADVDAGQMEKRFLLEGRMLAKLPHRNIVAVYDIVSDDNLAYISMEYLGGGLLSERMRNGLSLAEAVSVIVQIANALEFAHNHGVVHRDLKPANIMFRDTGTPVLTDFGIARYQDGSAVRLTQTGMLVGTPTYMSPEQINGVQVDGRADQYSLGILFHELLTGAPPFRAETSIAVLMAHLSQPLTPLPVEFRAFDDVIARMLAKNRDDRYPNLKEFNEDLKSRLVNSDTLLMRLQVDPNQPSSEQLRALGFSTSTPGAGGVRDYSAPHTPVPRPMPASTGAAKSPAAAAVTRKRTLLAIAAGVIAMLVIAVVGWQFRGEPGSLTQDERELVSLWLERAEHRLESNQLIKASNGGEGSAIDYVQRVLQKDPTNPKAQVLLDRIGVQLLAQGEAAVAAGNFDKALALVNQGLQLRPRDANVLALKARIEQAQKPSAQVAQAAPAPAVPSPTTASTQTQSVPAPAATTAPAPAKPAEVSAAAAEPKSAAARGELILNAQPWANVESVLDEQQQPVKLPVDTSTPLTLQLPAGKYVVTFRNPLAPKSVQITTTVDASKRGLATAVFTTTSTQGYFSRAGW